MADELIPPITSVVELEKRLLGLARKINPETNELDESAFKLLSPTQRLGLDAEFARYLNTDAGKAAILAIVGQTGGGNGGTPTPDFETADFNDNDFKTT